MYKIKDAIKFIIAYIWSLSLKKKDIWLVTERRAESKDNGYYFFKYMRENYPDKQVYYAIDKESDHIKKIEQYSHIVYFNSLKHYAYAIAATRLIGAFLPVGIPDSICFYKFSGLIKGKKIFLQHGITKENIKSLHYENTKISLFLCGGEPEAKFIKKEFGYPMGSVKYTGFCRYDGLKNVGAGTCILFMPTWRQWLPSASFHSENTTIKESNYLKQVKALLNNKCLHDLLEKNNIKLIFYPHHELQCYLNMFEQKYDENIIIASEKKYDVQKLLLDCKCLITDYSSVAFDVAYMKKPIIYYQFDEEEYYEKHYPRAYFSYEKMGFGKKCIKTEDVINELYKIIMDNYAMDSYYQKRVEEFFAYSDQKNCERVYEAINSL